MSVLLTIKKAGFDLTLVDDLIEISPASKLTRQQREFLKLHKAEIILELQPRPADIELQTVKCGDCLKFKSFNAHGKGAGTCLAGVQPNGVAWWSETPHECAHTLSRFFCDEPQGETVTCSTPKGNNP